MMHGETIRTARLYRSEFEKYLKLMMKDRTALNIPCFLVGRANASSDMTMSEEKAITNTSKV
jgi:hypothetical protein